MKTQKPFSLSVSAATLPKPIGRVLLFCHKNKWHDLWRKLITCLFLRKHSYLPKKHFRRIRMFSCPPPKTKKKWRVNFTSQIMFLWQTNRTCLWRSCRSSWSRATSSRWRRWAGPPRSRWCWLRRPTPRRRACWWWRLRNSANHNRRLKSRY